MNKHCLFASFNQNFEILYLYQIGTGIAHKIIDFKLFTIRELLLCEFHYEKTAHQRNSTFMVGDIMNVPLIAIELDIDSEIKSDPNCKKENEISVLG